MGLPRGATGSKGEGGRREEEGNTVKRFLRCLVLFALCLGMAAATAQSFPTKPVRLLVAFPPGGGPDLVARLLAAKLTETLGQQFIVENRVGANGNIAGDLTVKATPDGHT